MSTLDVELNGDGVHSIEAPDRFTTTTPFSVELMNQGRSTHVHLHLDDDLDRIASLGEVNHFVGDEAVKRVHVSKRDVEESVRGKLKIVTGYGSNVTYVDVRIDPPVEQASDEVLVDETLSKPPDRTPPPTPSQQFGGALDRAIERGGVTALVLAFLAVGFGVGVAFVVDSALVFLVVGAVLATTIAVTLLALW